MLSELDARIIVKDIDNNLHYLYYYEQMFNIYYERLPSFIVRKYYT